MKYFLLFWAMLLPSIAFAHEDHFLGEGFIHAFYHVTFWVVFALVVFKAVGWVKKKKQNTPK